MEDDSEATYRARVNHPNQGNYDPYAKDAKIKEAYKEMNEQGQSARLRMDNVTKAFITNETKSLETLDQEKVRLTRELIMTISHNENVISTLRELLQQTEIHQKKLYYLRDSINQSSIINHDHVMELRKVLGK